MNNQRTCMEDAIRNMDDKFIVEALTYSSESKVKKHVLWRVPQIAAVIFIVLGIGGVSVYAGTKMMKETQVGEGVVYVGGYEEYMNDEGEHEVTDFLTTEFTESDGSTPWLDKQVKQYEGSGVQTIYHFADYRAAAEFLNVTCYFTDLPGELSMVTASDYRIADLSIYSISLEARVNGGSYSLKESFVDGKISEEAFIADNLYETENQRTYVNKDGVVLTLVDGYPDAAQHSEADKMITKVLILHEKYMGILTFSDMAEKDIYKVLDCLHIPGQQ